jgi:hypothetical protein
MAAVACRNYATPCCCECKGTCSSTCGLIAVTSASNMYVCMSSFPCCPVRVLRYGIKASGKSCAPLLPTLLETLPGRFSQVSGLFICSIP